MLFKVSRIRPSANIKMSTIFWNPSLRGFASEIDRTNASTAANGEANGHLAEEDYAADAKALAKTLPTLFPSLESSITASTPVTVFLTGATGFLGAYILRDLLSRRGPPIKVIAHVRALDPKAALDRVI
jgi:L-aminoadipate-semialdehyde dehydrogenase